MKPTQKMKREGIPTLMKPKKSVLANLVLLLVLSGVANAVPLLGGKYQTTGDVQGLLEFSRDFADIAASSEKDEQREIYLNVRFCPQIKLRFYTQPFLTAIIL